MEKEKEDEIDEKESSDRKVQDLFLPLQFKEQSRNNCLGFHLNL